MNSRTHNAPPKKRRTILIVALVLATNVLMVIFTLEYHAYSLSESARLHADAVATLRSKTEDVKKDIITLEGVSLWEETLVASSTASR
jgi:hypothetical protein